MQGGRPRPLDVASDSGHGADGHPAFMPAPRRLRALRASAAICHRALNEANSRPARTATQSSAFLCEDSAHSATLRLSEVFLPPSATSHLSFASSAVAIPPEIGKLPSRAAISWPERLRMKRRNSSAAGCIGVPGFWFT